MRYERVRVKRDTNTVHSIAVAPWEVPVLEFIFEDGNIEPTGTFEDAPREYPDAREELTRLEKAYGSDPKSGIPHAVSVFGSGRKGVRELARLIEAAQAEEKAEEKAAPKKAMSKPRSRRASNSIDADSLLS
jgi:hypothetical protein